MSTQAVSTETIVTVLKRAREATDVEGTFTVTALVDWTQKSETTVRAAVAQLVTDGAIVRAEGRGQYRVVTTDDKPTLVESPVPTGTALITHTAGEVPTVQHLTEQPSTEQPFGDLAAELDQDPSHAGLGYTVYAVGANGQRLTLKRTGTWVLTDDTQLANFKQLTELPVSGWAGDKRRAITEIQVYVTGSPMSASPVFVAKPQELKKVRMAG